LQPTLSSYGPKKIELLAGVSTELVLAEETLTQKV